MLGFRRAGEYTAPGGARRKVFLRHDGLQARLGLTQHRHGSQDAFDETCAGLDYLAFTVASRAELDAWVARLADAAVVHSPVTTANSVPGAAVLVFRDPDNIQLELFRRACRPRRSPPGARPCRIAVSHDMHAH